ncbi:MAG: hypothetical protein H7Y88_05105 [Phycisphaerales bacterium]|nr:hypothetical protein [Phycisphaerales bacterium]
MPTTAPTTPHLPPTAAMPRPAEPALSRRLTRLRAALRSLLVTDRVSIVLATVLTACVALAFADFFLRTPMWLRFAVWAILLVGSLAALARFVLPAIRFRPSLTDLALRVERTGAGDLAGLRNILASALDLARAGDPRAQPVIRSAAQGLGQTRLVSVLRPGRAIKSISLLALVGAAIAASWLAWPGLSRTGAQRILTPWAQVHWPKRTAIADATAPGVHPLGAALPLRAALLRAPGRPESARVMAMYRVHDGERWGPEQRVLLTSQDRLIELAKAQQLPRIAEPTLTGHLFERLIEPDALLAASGIPTERAEGELEYSFESEDDQTPTSRIKLVERPAVVAARATIQPPSYVAASEASARTIDLGPGSDERAVAAPVLEGSRIRLVIDLNKSIPTPAGGPDEAWITSALGAGAAQIVADDRATVIFDENSWTLEWIHEHDAAITPAPVDAYGLAASGDSSFRIPVRRDALPTVSVTSPDSDKVVLSTAVIDAAAEAQDDAGLAILSLQSRRAARPARSAGAPAEPLEEWSELSAESAATPEQAPRRQTLVTTLDLSTLELESGQELWISALAADTFSLGDRHHEPVRSTLRRLTIVSAEDFLAQVWNDLAGVRRSAMRLDEDQTTLGAASRSATGQQLEQAGREQAAITERLARERKDVERIAQRLQENRLADAELDQVLQEAGAILEQAAGRSAGASEAMRRAQDQPAPEPDRQQALSDTQEAQDQVAQAMSELASLLDRGQDTWAMKRALRRLLDEQLRLQEQTTALAQQSAGKPVDELSPSEKAQIAQTSREQSAAAQKAAEALASMSKKQEELKRTDPAGAQAAADATTRGTQDRVPERMEEAAQQIQQNQTSSAGAQQSKVIESLEQMLEDLENAGSKRDEALRRFLSTIIESLEALITDQKTQLASLAAATVRSEFKGLDTGMVRLNQNTLAVFDEAQAEAAQNGDAEAARPVLSLISSAGESQAAAVGALRAVPVIADDARTKEALSLQRLERALAEAKKLDEEAEERENDRRADELKKAYREALTQQVAISEETAPLVAQEPTRRTRAQAKALGEQQEALRRTLVALKEGTAELTSAVVFDYAHQRLDESMAAAASKLGEGLADQAVARRQQTSERLLRSLIEALEKPKPSNEFRENESSSGGGGGGQGGKPQLVPPIAQLKLLRAMQAEAMDLTRYANENPDDTSAADEATLLQQRLTDHATTLLNSLAPPQGPQPAPPEQPQ